MKKLLFLIIVFATSSGFAQTLTCCAKPADGMVAFANDPKFIASHPSPEPFNYTQQSGKMITFLTPDGMTGSAYVVMAATQTNNYLIVTHEWWGLNDYIKQRADELQKILGNINVIAVDMYDGKVATNADSAGKLMGRANDTRIKNIIRGAITYAGQNAHIITLGWCFGGGYSLQAAILADKQAIGCVMYYGMPEKDITKLKTLNCPVLGLFAEQDGWVSPEVVKTFQVNMKQAGKDLTVKSYNAKHGFANPSNPAFDKPDADAANATAMEFIKGLLK